MVNVFGDGISWEKHTEEVMREKEIFHKGNPDSSLILKNIKKYVSTGKLLDCGCHVGRWMKFFTEAGFDYTGVDQSEEVIKSAVALSPGVKFIHSFLWDMKFNEEFDVAVCIAVLQHNQLEEKYRIVPQVYKALKPNGIFFITESTLPAPTATQMTHQGWIDLVEYCGFRFLESWHENELGLHDHYLFQKEEWLEK